MPLDLHAIEGDLGPNYQGFALVDRTSGAFLMIPQLEYPGRSPSMFFMKEDDAAAVLRRVVELNPEKDFSGVEVTRVPLLDALRRIAAGLVPGIDAFVVYTPNDVFDWLREP